MNEDSTRTFTTVSKDLLRKFIPQFLLRERNIVLRLGPKAGQTYASLILVDLLGIRRGNGRRVPETARSFTFVCFGNIMRSAMAEALMRQAVVNCGLEERIQISSAGLHAAPGREAHPWAQEVSAELSLSLTDHRAKLLTREMVETSDAVLAMDFQNKAELLTLYPEFQKKIYMLSAYAEGAWQCREIPDPYLGDLETTRFCLRQLQTCIRNLMISTFPASARSEKLALPGS